MPPPIEGLEDATMAEKVVGDPEATMGDLAAIKDAFGKEVIARLDGCPETIKAVSSIPGVIAFAVRGEDKALAVLVNEKAAAAEVDFDLNPAWKLKSIADLKTGEEIEIPPTGIVLPANSMAIIELVPAASAQTETKNVPHNGGIADDTSLD